MDEISAVTSATRFAFAVVACSAVIFPAVTATSRSALFSATSAAISASFLVPAISARDLRVARAVFNSAAVIPKAPAITASCLAFCATRAASFVTRPASRSASFATLSSASPLTIASD